MTTNDNEGIAKDIDKLGRKLAKKTFKSVARSATRAPETALRIASELPTADIPDISLGDIGDAFSGISNIFQ